MGFIDDNINEIKKDYLAGMKPIQLSQKYNITINQLRNLIGRNKWANKKIKLNNKIEEKIITGFTAEIDGLTSDALKVLKSIIKDKEIKKIDKVAAIRSILDISGLHKRVIDNNVKLPQIVIE